MSQSIRQSELFASQEWQVLYRAFTQVNFNASDPTSINQALREYIQAHYPEEFNDWIESSVMVAYIDLLSYIAGSVALKIDINARENFLEVAEARESILRLARFLSYNPRRCQSARGMLKLIAVNTNDDVYDSAGNSLNGVTVQWDNPDDRNWYERFLAILNNATVQTNPFGVPLNSGMVSDIPTHLYRLNAVMGENSLAFNARVAGEKSTTPFSLCNGGFNDGETFYERKPNLSAPLHFFYRNDGAGNGSARTGFFFMFKQGTLSNTTFAINQPQANRVLDISATNVNDTDIWVQSVEDNGQVRYDWTKVPAIFSENITFNSLSATERNIYSVITRDDDRVSIRFSDGIFGEAPVGNIRVWYRSANGEQYTIRPSDMSNVAISIYFYNRDGVRKMLNMRFALQETVGNSARRETDNQIRIRAASVFGTQNRMVTGEDYNVFPLSSNMIKKLKSVSRIYSGHSRYIDLNDPTGTYQHTSVFADDGIMYHQTVNRYTEVPINFNRTPEEMLLLHIQPLLGSDEVRGYAQKVLMDRVVQTNEPEVPINTIWHRVSQFTATSTGYFSAANSYFTVGATLLVAYEKQGRQVEEWVTIGSVSGDLISPPFVGQRHGSVKLNQNIPDGARIIKIVPTYAQTLDEDAATALKHHIEHNLSFSLWYHPDTGKWTVETPETLSSEMNATVHAPAFKVASIDYSGSGMWRIAARGTRLAFESEKAIKWFHSGSRALDPETGARRVDSIRIIRINGDQDTDLPLSQDYNLDIQKLIEFGDGSAEATRIQTGFADSDEDGQPDIPDTFHKVVSSNPRLRTLFWRMPDSASKLTSFSPYYGVRVYEHESLRHAETANLEAVDGDIVAYQLEAANPSESGTFWIWNGTDWQRENKRFRVATGRGPNMAQLWIDDTQTIHTTNSERDGARINFHWKHYADSDHRIDPSVTSIIDMFVLTDEYDYLIRQWVANGSNPSEIPNAPSELDLRLTFREYEQFKMQSDTIIWRPVRYKLLFGNGADETLRAQFKIVRLPNAILSDGEIKSRTINAINTYFSADAWDFGATFYFSELSAYIHQQLIGSVASVEIVPMFADASFGDLREIVSRSDELFISTAQVSDIQIIGANTPSNLRMR